MFDLIKYKFKSPPWSFSKIKKSASEIRKCVYLLSILIRLALISYSSYHNDKFDLKYTDVDYKVFTDASYLVTKGLSPYERHTYRYTPLLSFLMVFNIYLFNDFGKIIFSASDIAIGYILEKAISNVNDLKRVALTSLWLLNPFVIGISSRGNADSLICLLVIATVYYINKKEIVKSAIMFGLSVHVKIYPIIYAPSFIFYLYNMNTLGIYSHKKFPMSLLLIPKNFVANINKQQITFGVISFLTFLICTTLSYWLYGFEFIYETYLYHYVRKDHRHNFSIYFNLMYYIVDTKTKMNLFLSFVPQLFSIVIYSIVGLFNLPLSMFLQTLSFVTLNKVCTSQYFLWWIVLLPLVFSNVKFNSEKTRTLLTTVFFLVVFKGMWLFWAYQLEFRGYNTFLMVCA
ncbi:mannosyltransferase, putative [Theileria equi strain WA]|uniref:GPI mannosyltransferase 1 n=1 Tax=Theileria equi strain WA TaxID=1537102 RepID=L0B2D0_THEEQ|nr:mannosyltransferase, putative [Theileria equi strain WA]AFZ81376.1 mannosyltransferase, putative [Theileria equi strain WA]|eukprot:XP_004831042.1 mannosyltransferase, putative [Theileria equi strain WA]